MKIPPKSEVDKLLRSLEPTRVIARQAIQRYKTWKSDAEKQKRPLSNQHDAAGAPLLNIDAVLRRSEPNDLLGKK
jgi:hypothetical protein